MLDTKIPPLLVVAMAALLMWAATALPPHLDWPLWVRAVDALLLALIGASICGAGLWQFRRARTTVNPVEPQRASALVTTGIYSITRNPMYLGFALLLAGWGVYLASPWAVVVLAGFVGYLTRFQIMPEERALQGLFGEEFERYRSQVRRWI